MHILIWNTPCWMNFLLAQLKRIWISSTCWSHGNRYTAIDIASAARWQIWGRFLANMCETNIPMGPRRERRLLWRFANRLSRSSNGIRLESQAPMQYVSMFIQHYNENHLHSSPTRRNVICIQLHVFFDKSQYPSGIGNRWPYTRLGSTVS